MTGWRDDPDARFTLAAFAAAGAGATGWRRGAMSGDGALTAWLVGVATVGFGGWWWGAVIVAFFVSSIALSALAGVPQRPSPPSRSWRRRPVGRGWTVRV